MKRKHRLSKYVILCSLIVVSLLIVAGQRRPAAGQPAADSAPNLLVNSNFDELPFYWRPPNHFVAGGWYRWWLQATVMPEFDDVNKPGGVRRETYLTGGHAQVYFKWGHHYTAGIFQVVHGLTPCRPYELTMHARTHSLDGAHPGSRIGLDPWGAHLALDGEVSDFTPLHRANWSREQTALFQWEELAVTAEPRGESMTAILYAAPRPGDPGRTHYYDTFWDAGALRAADYEGDRLPGPIQATTGLIYDVSTAVSSQELTVNWKLSVPATTQVWYGLVSPSQVVTGTDHLTRTVYLPLASQIRFDFEHTLPVNYDVTELTHTAVIRDYTPGQTINAVVLARRLVDGVCVTEYAGPFVIKTLP